MPDGDGRVVRLVHAAARAADLDELADALLAIVDDGGAQAGAVWSQLGHGRWQVVGARGATATEPPAGDGWTILTVTTGRRTTSLGLLDTELATSDRDLLEGALEAGLRRLEAEAAAEAATESGEQRLATVLDATPDAVVVVSPEGQILHANAQAVELFGYELSELVGGPVERLIPAELRDQHVAHRSRYTEAPTPRSMAAGQDLNARHRDGTAIPVDIALSPIDADGGPAVAAFVRDASARRHANQQRQRLQAAELAQRQALELNDNIVQSLTAAIWLVELEDRDTALTALRHTLGSARHMMDDLLRESATELEPGSLRRVTPPPTVEVAPATTSGTLADLLGVPEARREEASAGQAAPTEPPVVAVDPESTPPATPETATEEAAPPPHEDATPARATSEAPAPRPDPGWSDGSADDGIRVVLADDSADLRRLLELRLRMVDDLEVVATVADGQQVVEAVDEHRPDVVLMDLSMPRLDGLEATAEVRARHPRVRIVILTGHSSEATERQCVDAGADAFIEKGADFSELLTVVRSTLSR